jgi:Ras-related protein Rab-1A
MIVGNKSDLESKRCVSFETAKNWADKNKLPYVEVSAKNGSNIQQIFVSLAESILTRR